MVVTCLTELDPGAFTLATIVLKIGFNSSAFTRCKVWIRACARCAEPHASNRLFAGDYAQQLRSPEHP
jgi:hypothetical protein